MAAGYLPPHFPSRHKSFTMPLSSAPVQVPSSSRPRCLYRYSDFVTLLGSTEPHLSSVVGIDRYWVRLIWLGSLRSGHAYGNPLAAGTQS
jgi:hypothetical protein